MKTILFIALILMRGCTLCPASEISAAQATRAVIGEAASEPYQTQLAVASAIRNRGTLRGVLGLLNARMIDAQSPKTFALALRAWNESATNNIVNGATHFESENFKTPQWAKQMRCVAQVGRFKFYKPLTAKAANHEK